MGSHRATSASVAYPDTHTTGVLEGNVGWLRAAHPEARRRVRTAAQIELSGGAQSRHGVAESNTSNRSERIARPR